MWGPTRKACDPFFSPDSEFEEPANRKHYFFQYADWLYRYQGCSGKGGHTNDSSWWQTTIITVAYINDLFCLKKTQFTQLK